MKQTTVKCDRCGTLAELTSHRGKPKGWGTVTTSTKLHDPGTGYHPQETKRYDLCPGCAPLIDKLIEDGQ